MNAKNLQKWIDHLSEDEKTIPIYFKDKTHYFHGKSFIHRLTPPTYDENDIPPNDCFILNMTKYKKLTETNKTGRD